MHSNCACKVAVRSKGELVGWGMEREVLLNFSRAFLISFLLTCGMFIVILGMSAELPHSSR